MAADPVSRVKLVVSDVDGTIVQTDKSVSPGTVAAAQRLQDAGVSLAIVSARPPRGMTYITDTLKLRGPYAGFNGGMVVGPDGATLEWNPAPPACVRQALDLYEKRGISVFLFTQDEWLIRDPGGPHVEHERRTVKFDARVVPDFAPYVDQVGKLVGVTDDHPLLADAERELQGIVGDKANAVRSQTYYLDLTHPSANKGNAVRILAKHAGCKPEEVVAMGDQNNDIPMFKVAGYSVCMGNGSADAKRAAAATVEHTNDADGWAEAVDTLILPRARG